jgi:hypothetical protein
MIVKLLEGPLRSQLIRGGRNVRFGSLADIRDPIRDVRFTP